MSDCCIPAWMVDRVATTGDANLVLIQHSTKVIVPATVWGLLSPCASCEGQCKCLPSDLTLTMPRLQPITTACTEKVKLAVCLASDKKKGKDKEDGPVDLTNVLGSRGVAAVVSARVSNASQEQPASKEERKTARSVQHLLK